jgi:type IV pilus assembly protein PilM
MAEKKVIGIDFTNQEIRMAQVSIGRGLPKLERFALGPIPEGVFSGGRLVEPGKLAEAIKDLLRGYRFTSKKAILGISGKYGVTRMVTLPRMTAAQTRDAINLQLNQYVPFPPADTIYDFKVLREIKEEEQPSQEVLLVATRRTSIQPLIAVMKRAGLTLIGVKITTLASFSLFEDLYHDNEQAVAFVDVRDSVTDISFVAENYFRLSRSIEFGLTNLVERLRQKKNMTYEEAVDHLYRNKVDLMESYRPSSTTTEEGVVATGPSDLGPKDGAELDRQLGLAKSDDTIEKQVRDNVLRAMGQFVNELMRSIRYFESQQKRRARVGRVVIFGYIGGLSGLTEYLAEQTALDVTVVNEVPGVEVALDDAEQRELKNKEAVIVVPVALAVEGVKRKRVELNLIPRETMYRRKSFNALKFGVVIVIILMAVMAGLYIQRQKELLKFKEQEATLTKEINIVKPYYDKATAFKGYNTTVETKLKGVVTLAATQAPWPAIMDELGRLMRNRSFIDQMKWDANGGTWAVHGFCVGTDEVQMLLVNFYHSDILQGVTVEDLTTPSKSKKSDGKLGNNFGNRGGSGSNFGFSVKPPADAPVSLPTDTPGDNIWNSSDWTRPKPMYKVPEGGEGDLQTIEWYFQGHEFIFPTVWEFKLKGTINPAVMMSGKDLFGELSDLVSAAGAAPAAGGPKPGGGPAAPPAAPAAPPAGDAGDDSGV